MTNSTRKTTTKKTTTRKPANKGKFTSWAKRNGFASPTAAANAVMRNKSKYSADVVKMANFAKNFGK